MIPQTNNGAQHFIIIIVISPKINASTAATNKRIHVAFTSCSPCVIESRLRADFILFQIESLVGMQTVKTFKEIHILT